MWVGVSLTPVIHFCFPALEVSEQLITLLGALDDLGDVQNVYSTVVFSDEPLRNAS